MRIPIYPIPTCSLFAVRKGKKLIWSVIWYRLRALKAKLSEQRKHLDELDKHMYVDVLPFFQI